MKVFAQEISLALAKEKATGKSDPKLTTLLKRPKRKKKSSAMVTSWMARSESVKRRLRRFLILWTI